MLVTCHTPDCVNDGITIDVTDALPTDAPAPSLVLCGGCGQPITDVTSGESYPTGPPPADA